ncbi:MAG: hypothetical protein IMW86_06555 [Hydrogenibacillus sp.]|nr:hypothetical protein [Hydrogenibacillus sp.]
MDTAVRSPLAVALDRSKDPALARRLLDRVKDLAERFIARHGRPAAIMEVCGSHTHALAETGVKDALRGVVRLISGPGCPVCVTDQAEIDAMIALAEGEGRIIATFGDMLRVPGSRGSLMKAKVEKGADVRVVYRGSGRRARASRGRTATGEPRGSLFCVYGRDDHAVRVGHRQHECRRRRF